MKQSLCIFVIGASGDLAKKKTYPSLYELYVHNFLSTHTIICGYARSNKSDDEFRAFLSPFLKSSVDVDGRKKLQFLNMCVYRHGGYDSVADVGAVAAEMSSLEGSTGLGVHNRLFYFAIPPNVFVPAGTAIKHAALSTTGWNRLIVEKPFGHDLASCNELCDAMGALYDEDAIYRIDHYLGKEMVQNLLVLRFSNATLEPLWNRRHISSVTITFKEDIGTMGRGGYFDSYGIIRDVMQNHLLQVLSLVAMEPPVRCTGDDHATFVRNEKVKVLRCIEPVELDDVVLGQYVGNAKEPGWDGVPFIMKAGKALNERKAEVRIQFREAAGATQMFPNMVIPRNELVLRLQPSEAVYLKTNVKSPGLRTTPISSELDLSYAARYADTHMPDAYTRLMLDVLRGYQSMFVRNDELQAAWAIFTPLLQEIETKKVKPLPYAFGSRGPVESDDLSAKHGFIYHQGDYKWQPVTSSL
ncbi:hypothetical protein DYB35_000229 [Aphanomyces astaci]|uniref:glucose-6-phosphate dehydrogenase (NADP(+)) n=1 Tax=Aphanomyces astaci TaxID=112090 RepID=A0A418D5N7_APHAT|nr:hypothetical protein DYB35_000229 [Aphanomyces astaci]